MATTRPLMQLGIGDLEDIFEKQGKNPTTLARLKHELSHRQVPRALALLERIHKAEALLEDLDSHRPGPSALSGTLRLTNRPPAAAPSASPMPETSGPAHAAVGLSAIPEQQDLLRGLPPPIEARPTKMLETVSPLPDVAPLKKSTTPTEPVALPQLAIEDACRILKVALGDVWEKVEASRRQVVLKSSPLATKGLASAQAQKLQAEAQLANDAAIVIAARRSGRQ
jgi:hypothetical protein